MITGSPGDRGSAHTPLTNNFLKNYSVTAPRVAAKPLPETPTGQDSWETKISHVQGEFEFRGGLDVLVHSSVVLAAVKRRNSVLLGVERNKIWYIIHTYKYI